MDFFLKQTMRLMNILAAIFSIAIEMVLKEYWIQG